MLPIDQKYGVKGKGPSLRLLFDVASKGGWMIEYDAEEHFVTYRRILNYREAKHVLQRLRQGHR